MGLEHNSHCRCTGSTDRDKDPHNHRWRGQVSGMARRLRCRVVEWEGFLVQPTIPVSYARAKLHNNRTESHLQPSAHFVHIGLI